jgi:hypothetical protein
MTRSRRILITLSALTLSVMTALTATVAATGQPQHHVTANGCNSGGGASKCCGCG